MMGDKKHCVMLGVCFSVELAYLLRLSERFERDFTVSAYGFTGNDLDFTIPNEEFERASVVMYHPTSWTGWKQEDGYPLLTARFPKHIHHITFPYPVFNFLWPCHALDPRFHNVRVGPLDDNNSLLYAYADSTVLKMRQQGKSPSEIINEYSNMDLSSTVDLDRLFEHVIEVQRFKEAETDVKVLDFALEHFKKRQVFSCVNHGSNLLMIHMADQILAGLDCPPLPRYAHEALCELMDPTVPIHPSIARYYNLAWAVPGLRCRIDRRRNLTWEEYIYQLAIDHDHREGLAAGERSSAARRAVDEWLESVLARFTDPSLGFSEIVDLCRAYLEAYPKSRFPPVIEKKALELALSAHPEREDLTIRLAQVEMLLKADWPLLQFEYDAADIDANLIAEDGVEAALLALPVGKRRIDHALAAFHRYMAKGRPERYPAQLTASVMQCLDHHLPPASGSALI